VQLKYEIHNIGCLQGRKKYTLLYDPLTVMEIQNFKHLKRLLLFNNLPYGIFRGAQAMAFGLIVPSITLSVLKMILMTSST
jgi:hypothetical protein